MEFPLAESAVFWKTKEKYGALSNMAGGFPIWAGACHVRSSEHLYQALKFSDPDLQAKVCAIPSPLFAAKYARTLTADRHEDWHEAKLDLEAMRYVVFAKAAQHWEAIGKVLDSTADFRYIVERSRRDDYWGALLDPKKPAALLGDNHLGLIWGEVRGARHLLLARRATSFMVPSPERLRLFGRVLPSMTLTNLPARARVGA